MSKQTDREQRIAELDQRTTDYERPFKELQEWAMAHEPSDEMLYKESFWHQIIFVRDTLRYLLQKSYWITVPSTHHSKSIELPVYRLGLRDSDGQEFLVAYMRDNFYDWKVSIETREPLNLSLDGLISASPVGDNPIKPVYCEGFRDEWVYPPYTPDSKQFTVEIGGDYRLWTFFWLITSKRT